MHQVQVVLRIEVFQLAVVVAGGEVVVPLVAEAGVVELVRGGAAGELDVALATVGDGHVLVVLGVALVHLGQVTGIDGQAADFQRVQRAAAEGLRQGTGIVGHDDRQFRRQGAYFQHALRDAQFAGDAEVAKAVLSAAGLAVAKQQTGAAAVGAGVELQAQAGQRIHAHADEAVGEAGFVFEDEALGPLFLLGLARHRVVGLAEVAVVVVVAQLDAGLAVLEELSLRQGRQDKGGTQHGLRQSGGGKAGEVLAVHQISPQWFWTHRVPGYRAAPQGLAQPSGGPFVLRGMLARGYVRKVSAK
ncbi:hypothetical protein D3C76_995810 [compost metagenome]